MYTRESVVEAVRKITNGAGVAAVYDGVGKDTYVAPTYLLLSLRSPRIKKLIYYSSLGLNNGWIATFLSVVFFFFQKQLGR